MVDACDAEIGASNDCSVTGWAQINGWRGEINNETKIQKRVEFDLYYIENWSVLFDLYILGRTPLALLKAENAC
jgi:lipopolysaccharide/colanic/teichoic acid biosynthesis glycosyltransferase